MQITSLKAASYAVECQQIFVATIFTLNTGKAFRSPSPDTGKSPVYDMVARTHIAVRNVHLKGQTNRQVVTPAYFENN